MLIVLLCVAGLEINYYLFYLYLKNTLLWPFFVDLWIFFKEFYAFKFLPQLLPLGPKAK